MPLLRFERWVLGNEDKCCVVTQRAAHIRVAWIVYVRTYCVRIATLHQNKRTRLLYLCDAQVISIIYMTQKITKIILKT